MGKIEFTVNGQTVSTDEVSPTTTLLAFLRNQLHLTGTKEGCAEGDCGACTVAVLDSKNRRYQAVNACLLLLPMVQGKDVITIEGLKTEQQFHPAQESLVQKLGSQCGYCTPGVVMSMFEACYRDDLDAAWKIDDQMCGNLCRCTGYRPIKEATQEIAGTRPPDQFLTALKNTPERSMALDYQHGEQSYFIPDSLKKLWTVIKDNPGAQFVCGGTDLSLSITKRFESPPLLISVEAIEALHQFVEHDNHFEIGAAVDLARLESLCASTLAPITRMLRFFGSRQIKNRASIGGNICNASPIGDLPPILIALGSEIILSSQSGQRRLALEDFFLDYRKTALQEGEILSGILIPKIPSNAKVVAYKVSKRQELDISAVAAGLYVEIENDQVVQARFAFGGMAATPSRAKKTEAALVGQTWSESNIETAVHMLDQDFSPLSDHRGSAWYRQTVAKNLLRGFFLEAENHNPKVLGHRPTATIQLASKSGSSS